MPQFSSSHVMQETFKHMHRCINVSRTKTTARIGEFEDHTEFLLALSNLAKIEKLIESIEEANPEMFQKETSNV